MCRIWYLTGDTFWVSIILNGFNFSSFAILYVVVFEYPRFAAALLIEWVGFLWKLALTRFLALIYCVIPVPLRLEVAWGA